LTNTSHHRRSPFKSAAILFLASQKQKSLQSITHKILPFKILLNHCHVSQTKQNKERIANNSKKYYDTLFTIFTGHEWKLEGTQIPTYRKIRPNLSL
jgi:hypothetical protein